MFTIQKTTSSLIGMNILLHSLQSRIIETYQWDINIHTVYFLSSPN